MLLDVEATFYAYTLVRSISRSSASCSTGVLKIHLDCS